MEVAFYAKGEVRHFAAKVGRAKFVLESARHPPPLELSGDNLAAAGLETAQPIKQPDGPNIPGCSTIYIYKDLNIDP